MGQLFFVLPVCFQLLCFCFFDHESTIFTVTGKRIRSFFFSSTHIHIHTHGCCEKVGTKERKSGSFGGCFSRGFSSEEEEEEEGEGSPGVVAYLARPGLRMWTADNTGKVGSTLCVMCVEFINVNPC